jgi:hypothetical protein
VEEKSVSRYTAAVGWLALSEETRARGEFGGEREAYAARTKWFIPRAE